MFGALSAFFSSNNNKKSVVLVRISSEYNQSSDNQKWKLLDYVSKNKVQNYQVFESKESASKFDVFPKYMEPLADKNVSKVYVTAIDRFSRCYVNVIALMERRDNEKLTVHDIHEDKTYVLDKFDMPKDFIEKIRIAEQEAKNISERSKRSQSIRKDKKENLDRVPLEAWDLIEGEVQDFLIKGDRFSEVRLINTMWDFFSEKSFPIRGLASRCFIKILIESLEIVL